MFDNLSWSHLLVLGLAALFILGPQRLPEAAAWLARAFKQIREFSNGARAQLEREIGPQLHELREPIEQLREPLRELRELDPRRSASNWYRAAPNRVGHTADPPPQRDRASPGRELAPGEYPPVDPDAT